jgi:hypothetical protein
MQDELLTDNKGHMHSVAYSLTRQQWSKEQEATLLIFSATRDYASFLKHIRVKLAVV